MTKSYSITKEVSLFFWEFLFKLNRLSFLCQRMRKKKILKFWCLEKNTKTIFILQNISLYKNPEELFYYLDDKDNMGCEKGKKILKLDLKYFWIKFSTLITARLSDLRGTLYRERMCVEPAREMLWIRRKACLYFGVLSFFQYKLIWHEPSPQYEACTF